MRTVLFLVIRNINNHGSKHKLYNYSVVVMRDATDAASTRAVLTTLVGSMIPALIMLTYWSLAASYPNSSSLASRSFPTTTAPSPPAFWTMVLMGSSMALLTIYTPMF